MISFAPIWAVVLRHAHMFKRDFNLILMTFYWPLLDILIWGFLGAWIQQSTRLHNYETMALLGVLLWQIIGRGCNTMLMTFTEEIWSNNIVNLFSLPLHIVEWMCGIVLFTAIIMSITSAFCMSVIFAMYKISAWDTVSTFLIFAPPLFFSALWIGFMCLQAMFTLGRRGVEIGYVLAWFFMPFSGAYYPIEVLPSWGQAISNLIPMSYVFRGMRGYLMHQQDPTVWLLKAYALSILYATCSIAMFIYCFNRSKRHGLTRLSD